MIDLQQLERAAQAASEGRASALRVADNGVSLMLDVTGLNTAARDAIDAAVTTALMGIDGVAHVRIAQTAHKVGRRIIAVGSGKGGVGKSTIAANLAVALARTGRTVGLVDADIYGPSQPRLMGCEGTRPEARDKQMIPVPTAFGLSMLSMGQLVPDGQAIAWRGPMASNALAQMIDAAWGDAEILVVDLPPGTGDVLLSMLQKHRPDAAIIVSTPQDLSWIDAARALSFFQTAAIPVIGLIENMAGYVCPHCGQSSDPFGHGGAAKQAAAAGLELIGRIPLAQSVRMASDAGAPPAAREMGDDGIFTAIAAYVSAWLDANATAQVA